tara:strand:+ start:71 stop:1138 length:1068 start_codon:yes stop_codon:yes gene_type:complete
MKRILTFGIISFLILILVSPIYSYTEQELQEEIKVGRSIASILAGLYGVYDNPETVKYVNLVGRSIVYFNGRHDVNFYFNILNSEKINAFACPGGYVFLTKGLLKAVKNEAELAGILGHEVAHVNYRHIYNNVSPKKAETVDSFLTRILGARNVSFSVTLSQVASKSLNILFKEGLQHKDEYEADSAAIYYMVNTGYNPRAYYKFIERMREKRRNQASFSKTHPPYDKRLGIINDILVTIDEKFGQTLADRYEDCIKFYFSKTHPSIKKRLKRIDKVLLSMDENSQSPLKTNNKNEDSFKVQLERINDELVSVEETSQDDETFSERVKAFNDVLAYIDGTDEEFVPNPKKEVQFD